MACNSPIWPIIANVAKFTPDMPVMAIIVFNAIMAMYSEYDQVWHRMMTSYVSKWPIIG